MNRETKPKSRTNNLVTINLENEVLIYDLKNNKAYCLNKTSAMVWEASNGKNTVSDMSKLLSYKPGHLISEELILLALDGLKQNDLLEIEENFLIEFSHLSRREIIKKIGLSSMIALPVIASIVAPNAVMAASCSFPGLLAPGDFGTWINPPNVFCGDPGDLCNPSFCANRGISFCRSCTGKYDDNCTNNSGASFCTCSCV